MVAAVVPPVVGGLLGAVTSNVVAVVAKLIGKSYDLWSDFDNDIECIRSDLRMIAGAEEDQLSGEDHDLSIVMSISKAEMHDLALEIEDFLDRVQRYVVDGGPFHAVLGFASKPLLEIKVKELKEKLKNAYHRKSNHKVNGSLPSTSSTFPANTYATNIRPVGIDDFKKEIHAWVMKDVQGEPAQLSVVSIVGFSGSGKSTLANEVYESRNVVDRFPHRARVVASDHRGNTKGLLTELFEKLGQKDQICDSEDVQQLRAKISNYLMNTKRYLIVLDDIKNLTWWNCIKSAFPEKATGRIIVTTTNQTVARVCSRGNGYVHNMASLSAMHSKELMKAVLNGHSPGFERSSMSIVNKCDGHPHALVTLANYLLSEDAITNSVCEKLCKNLGFRMATEDALEELQKVLMNNYRRLPKEFLNLKACLLYLCVFPNGCHIRASRLMRRWLAEGYVQSDYPRSALVVANDNLKKLVDQSIIWPIDTSKDAIVKTCRAHGIFHEFLLHMSLSGKFITSFQNPEKRHYRHLFIQNTSNPVNHRYTNPAIGGKSDDDEERPRAHSLTICGSSAGEAVRYFAKCQLLRVLDLEECNDLEDEHLDGIHELWHLTYLSVGDTISRLPKGIEKLYFLATLDMRKTKKEIILPVEVLMLPYIAHLLGRFKLQNKQKSVPERSKLQTLSGFVTDQNDGFQMLMDHLKQLRKVKIWAIWRNSNGEVPYLERFMHNFVQAEQDTAAAVRSLSLDIGSSSGNILRSLAYGLLRSLKLHGNLSGLVHFVTELYSLKELCLSSTNDLTENDLSRLLDLNDLECLKLVGISLGRFVIASEDFPGLLHLCLVQCPSLPTIEQGALPHLLSLRLLDQCLEGLSGIEIKWHKVLQEIALDSEVKPETKKKWENAAKIHPKRPRILFLKRVDPNETGPMVKYVATEKPPPEMDFPIMRRKRNNSAVQPDSSMEIDSPIKQMKLSEASAATSEPPTAMDDGMSSSSSADPDNGDSILVSFP
ncbi:hypothetical protein U9M48_001807 [Paspalum notatum var. saurae]|uniref:NB-ARC domain-containing protein n=1 Tax=Paspalum notatum var. saurae TaxID=547442 RepID=A0AAQ3SIK8_PASNO